MNLDKHVVFSFTSLSKKSSRLGATWWRLGEALVKLSQVCGDHIQKQVQAAQGLTQIPKFCGEKYGKIISDTWMNQTTDIGLFCFSSVSKVSFFLCQLILSIYHMLTDIYIFIWYRCIYMI